MASGLVPLLADPATLRAVMVELPQQHAGMSSVARIFLFAVLCLFAVAAAIWGALSVFRLRNGDTARLNVLFAVQFGGALVLLECGLRLGIAVGVPVSPFNNLTYFTNPVCGDTFYRLSRTPAAAFANKAFDPVLGWVENAPAGHASGLRWPPALDGRQKIWFFGDSFMAGVGKPDESIPARYEAARAETQSLNYGVPGYGVDQIWLRYQRTAPEIPPGSRVVIGLLTTDVDRSVLAYFYGFKPVFKPEGASYVLTPPPDLQSGRAMLTQDGNLVGSYALAVVRAIGELVEGGFDRSEVSCDRDEKIALNRYLIGQIVAEADRRGHDLAWIVFTGHSSFAKPRNWRYDLLTRTLREKNQVFLDSRAVLNCAAQISSVRPESFYIPDDGHLTPQGNDVVASALARLVSGMPPACPASR